MGVDVGEKGWIGGGNLGEVVIAGAVTGFLTRALTQPFDVLKIRFQLQVEPVIRDSNVSKYRALAQAVQTIIREEGHKGLWSGHSPAQLLSIFYGIVQFGVFEALMKDANSNNELWRFTAGASAGTLATTVTFPFDVVRTRFVAQGNYKKYRWTGEGLIKLWQVEGVKGMLRGLSPALLQAAPNAGTIFLVHNVVTRINTYFHVESTIWAELLAGGAAGIVGKTVVYPLDLARKRLQLQGFQDARIGFGKNFTCSGLVHCLVRTLNEEGLRGLFKGLVPTWLKAASTTAMYFTIYQEMIKYLKK